MTNMKIQKLVYFAQGYFLAIYGRPLIQEDFVVWKYGSVVRRLYSSLKRMIDQQESWGTKHSFDESLREQDNLIAQVEKNDVDAIGVINSVWRACKDHKASCLSRVTHRSDSPWTTIRSKEGDRAVIPKSEIARYFQNLINAN